MAASAPPSHLWQWDACFIVWAEQLVCRKKERKGKNILCVVMLVCISTAVASSLELLLMRPAQKVMMISEGRELHLRRNGLSQGKAPGDNRFHFSLSLGCVANQNTSSGSCWADSGLCSAALLTMACSSCTQLMISLESREFSDVSIIQCNKPDCGNLHCHFIGY